MRKFSRILASLLAVMLLLGTLAVSVFAAADAENQLNLTNADLGIYAANNHSSSVVVATDFSDGKWLGGSGSDARMTFKYFTDAKGNKYASMYNDGTSSATGNSIFQDINFVRGCSNGNGTVNPNNPDDKLSKDAIIKNDFLVIDYEVSTDSFVVAGFYSMPEGLTAGDKGFAVYEDGTAYQRDGKNVNYASLTDALILGTYLAKDANGYAIWTEAAVSANFKDNSGNVVTKGARLTLADGSNMQYSALKLAYLYVNPNVQLRAYDDAGTTSYGSFTAGFNAGKISYKESENQWYITLAGADFPLSKNVGEWNHVTLVMCIDNTINYTDANGKTTVGAYDFFLCEAIQNKAATYLNAKGETVNNPYASYTTNLANSRVYAYLNGEYKKDASAFSSGSSVTTFANVQALDNLNLYVIRFQAGNSNKNSAGTLNYRDKKMSHCYDNFAANWYRDGYVGDLADHMTNNPTNPIYNCSDVVYNGNYNVPSPNASLGFVTYDEEGDTVSYDLAVGAVDAAIINSGYATISSDVKGYKLPAGQNPSAFFVKTVNGATFTLAEGTGYIVSDEPNADGYYVVAPSSEIQVLWFDSAEDYFNGLDFSSFATLKVGDSLINDAFTPAPDKYIGNGKILAFAGWAYSVCEDDELVALEGNVLTQKIFEEAMDEDEMVYIVPVYAERTVVYVVEKDGVETPYETAANIRDVINVLTDSYKITLYTDINVSVSNNSAAYGFFEVANGEEATWNLNGHNIIAKSASSPNLFMVREGATLNIYSSEKNGTIYVSDGAVFRLQRAASTGAMQNSKINLGEAANPAVDGDNISIYCAVLLEVSGAKKYVGIENDPMPTDGYIPCTAEGKIDWEAASEVNIKGGLYLRHTGTTYAMMCVRGIAKINVEDAKFIETQDCLLATDSRYWCETQVTFKNSEVICQQDVVIQLQAGSTMNFIDCTVVGNFTGFDPSLYFLKSGTTAYTYYVASTNKTYYYFYEENAIAAGVDYTEKTLTADTQVYSNVVKDLTFNDHSNGRIYFNDGTKISDINGFKNQSQINWNGLTYVHISEAYSISYNLPTPDFTNGTLTYAEEDTVYEATLSFLAIDPAKLVSGIKANLTTNNGFYVNFYVPVASAALGIYTDAAMTTAAEVVAYNAEYNMVRVAAPAGSTSALSVYIKLQDAEGNVYAQEVKLSLLGYFNAVLNNEEATKTEKTLVVNAVNYCNELYKVAAKKTAGYTSYNNIITANADLIIAAENLQNKEMNLNPEVVKKATFIIGNGNVPTFAFVVSGEDVVVTASYKKLGGEVATVTLDTYVDGETTYYVISEMAVYDMIGEVTVYVNGDESLVYSINDYINATENAIAKALYGYAKAVIAYKTQN